MYDITGDVTDLENLKVEAFMMWQLMMPQIRKLASKVSKFSTMLDAEELEMGLAYEACYEGCLRFQKCIEKKYTSEDVEDLGTDVVGQIVQGKMKKTTFIYWYLQKKLYKEVDTGEVVFIVENSDGSKEVLSNYEFRKRFNKEKLKKLENSGVTIRSERLIKTFGEMKTYNDKDYEPPDMDFDKL